MRLRLPKVLRRRGRCCGILSDVEFRDWRFHVGVCGVGPAGHPRHYLQVRAEGPCAVTGQRYEWGGRKWLLSDHMTKSEVIQTALAAVLAAVEHEAREGFKYRGRSVFCPHYDVERLHSLRLEGRDGLDVREEA